jgi:alpha-beta hydrolase superfamily lysophospholipase
MKHAPPAPPTLGDRDGLAYALFLPEGEPSAAVVILHGAGSAKESHFDYARVCRAQGLAAIAFDARGHGRSQGRFGPGAIDDVLSICALAREHAPAVALRGSSMGGFCAIHAGARDPELCAVVAICAATGDGMARSLRSGRLPEFACDVEATADWLETADVYRAVAQLGERTSLLLLHARGDETVPVAVSERLLVEAHEPKRLVAVEGGHHRSVQHDAELQALSVTFIERAARALAG